MIRKLQERLAKLLKFDEENRWDDALPKLCGQKLAVKDEIDFLEELLEDRCPKCGAAKVSRMVPNEANPQDKSLTEERVCPVCK